MFNTQNSFHVTVKPIGAECNLACQYCYYLHKKETLCSRGRMDDATLEAFVRQYIESQPTDTVFFTWHGGEPTLLGVDFFKKAVLLQQKYANGKRIENDIQTNGLFLDETWGQFLKENRFLVGLSIDGPADLNHWRATAQGKNSTEGVIKAAMLLKKFDIPFNTLTVVHYENAKRPLDVYRFLKDVVGSRHMQFIPCVEPKNFTTVAPLTWDSKKLPVQGTPAAYPGQADSFVTDWTVDPRDWGKFLVAVFDEWYAKDQGDVFVYLFENFLSLWLGRGAQSCVFDEKCGHAMALDRDGSVYACDHFCYPEYKYGNIKYQPLSEIGQGEAKEKFSALKQKLPAQCLNCIWKTKCYGECPKKRFLKTTYGEPGLNYLCEGYKFFFEQVNRKMLDLCRKYG
ncbi:MAG: anaerobic sulfatase maturase [Lactobacillales bacterium]|jgi:uncharacterized protein|nr:anaerobic sulfatase maturase [Lactobacillales bacterium]